MRVALQVDQLFFQAPGGIGTYIRNLVPAMAARDPALQLTLFHARFASHGAPERWMREHWVEELRYHLPVPRDLLAGRPGPLRAADVLHATSHASVRRPATVRPVVIAHDLAPSIPAAVPEGGRMLFAGLRAAVGERRDRDAVEEHG
jgi:hypothetical protein